MHTQWGDDEDAIKEAVDMCPVDCISFVSPCCAAVSKLHDCFYSMLVAASVVLHIWGFIGNCSQPSMSAMQVNRKQLALLEYVMQFCTREDIAIMARRCRTALSASISVDMLLTI